MYAHSLKVNSAKGREVVTIQVGSDKGNLFTINYPNHESNVLSTHRAMLVCSYKDYGNYSVKVEGNGFR